ncbi:MAG: S41 family peptidase, partial [Planctomycetia bacterium]|nr:S41 family peptidase [Planctomycetia bacterium]
MSLRDHRILWTIVLVCFLCCLRADRTNRDLLYLQNQIVSRSLKPPEESRLFEDAAAGMVASLDDPYAAYVPESQTQQFHEMIDSTMRGIGIEMRIDPTTRQPIVISPVDGSPAQRAGLRAGDRIVLIEGQETTGRTLQEVRDRIQGEVNSEVRLRLVDRMEVERDVVVAREEFPVPTVLGDTRLPDGRWIFRLRENPSIGYFRITSFGQLTAAELEIAIIPLLNPQKRSDGTVPEKLTGLILDLRGNPGGLLEQGILTCDLFMDHGVIVTARGRDQRIDDVREATPDRTIHTHPEFPMVILIDADTASAAEIVAACLADHGRAILVGDRSYGKGTIQQTVPMPHGRGILKLTTGSYWRPSNRNIHRFQDATDLDDWGVTPDPEHQVKPDLGTEVRRLVWRTLFDAPDPTMIPVSESAPEIEPPETEDTEGTEGAEGAEGAAETTETSED